MTFTDITDKRVEDMTPEEQEKLLNDPRIRELQHKMMYGGDKFELEVTNEKPKEIKNIRIHEGATKEEQMEAIQEAMREDQANKDRTKKEEERRAAKAWAERCARSDVWMYVVEGAGTTAINGTYHRNGESIRNGARVFKGPHDYCMSRECVSGGEGWIIGKAPRAFYAYQTKDKLASEKDWSVQEHGKPPAPTVRAVEPYEAVEMCKQQGNAFFKEGTFDKAVERYTESLRVASVCAGGHGLTEDVLGKLFGNRSEAHLQLEHWQEAKDDADEAMTCDPTFVKAYVRKAKALYHMDQTQEAEEVLKDALEVLPGNKEVLSLQEEYRVAALARSGSEAALSELSGLCSRFQTLVKKKGMASEVTALLRQMPMLLMALKVVPDKDGPGGTAYEQQPNHDAQVFLRLATNNFTLLAPLVRPNSKQMDLLAAVLETLAAGLAGCTTNQVVFDKYVMQLVPLLRNKDSMPLEVLRGATKVLGAMAHRASARRVMHDPDTAEGLMHVLSYPDSSAQRLHLAVITALDDMKDVNTIANLLAVPGACDTFWREAHSRQKEVHCPSRSLIARAMSNAICRRRLKLIDRCKRVVDLFEKICNEAKVVEEYTIGPVDGKGPEDDDDDDFDSLKWSLRDIASLAQPSTSVLIGFLEGLASECAGNAELIETLTRYDSWVYTCQMLMARPPLSTAALRFTRVCMQQHQSVIDKVVQLGVPMWLLQCREPSDVSDDFNANVSTTMLSQAARDDALQILGFAANQGVFHECAELFESEDVLHAMMELMDGNPSDDAACGGCRSLTFLITYKKGKRRAALSARDVHDVLIPLYLRKQEVAKDAVMKALRTVLSNQEWIDKAMKYFEERGSVNKLYQVVQEMNGLQDLKETYTTGKKADKLRPGGKPIEESLEATHRLENLQPKKLVDYLCRELPPNANIVDVGAGTGIFTFEFTKAVPEGRVVALEIRSDAIRFIRKKAKLEQASNISAMRISEKSVCELPDGLRADIVLVCDVLEFIPEADRETYLGTLRSLLSKGGKLVVVNDRSMTDTFLIDIQDAGFLQKRCAQIVTNRRLMIFEADPAAPDAPPLPPPPPDLPEDSVDYEEPSEEPESKKPEPTGEVVDEGEDDACILEDNPLPGGAQARSKDVEDDDDDCCVLEEQDDGGCVLEEQDEGGCVLEEQDDDGGCVLEEQDDDGGCVLEEQDDDGGCVLEEQDDDDGECLLEDN